MYSNVYICMLYIAQKSTGMSIYLSQKESYKVVCVIEPYLKGVKTHTSKQRTRYYLEYSSLQLHLNKHWRGLVWRVPLHVDWLLQPSVFINKRFDKNINSANCSAVDYPVLPFTAYTLPLKRFTVPEVRSTVLLPNTKVISLKPRCWLYNDRGRQMGFLQFQNLRVCQLVIFQVNCIGY